MRLSLTAGLTAVLIAAAWLSLDASALARVEPAPHRLAVAYSPAITDGRRYVVYAPNATALLIRDEQTGRSRAVSIGSGCGHSGARTAYFSLGTPRLRPRPRPTCFSTPRRAR